MILVDYSRLSIANIVAMAGMNSGEISVDFARHFILNSIRAAKVKLSGSFGKEIVIACDSNTYWRRDFFPYYKASRKAAKEASSFDWDALYKAADIVKQELKEYFPYKVIEIPGAEADDIIASICKEYGNMAERICIFADDKDFFQLQSYMNVVQYDPVRKRGFVTCPSPENYKKEHILRAGDDGIPNILSDGDTFVVPGKRQKPLREAKMKELLKSIPADLESNYNRNKTLIDFDEIPPELHTKIIEEYQVEPKCNRNDLMNFFVEKKLRNLLSEIQDF